MNAQNQNNPTDPQNPYKTRFVHDQPSEEAPDRPASAPSAAPAPRPTPAPVGPARPDEGTELVPPDGPAAPVLAWLVFSNRGSPRFGDMVRLLDKTILLGRSTDCEVMIEDRTASRQHAKIRVEQQADQVQFLLHDLATDNGTFVNGVKIAQPTALNNNDVIRIGYTEMTFKRI
jgi:pSer/pThr/pTyr-binding forkhead associated (FHA) protein